MGTPGFCIPSRRLHDFDFEGLAHPATFLFVSSFIVVGWLRIERRTLAVLKLENGIPKLRTETRHFEHPLFGWVDFGFPVEAIMKGYSHGCLTTGPSNLVCLLLASLEPPSPLGSES